MLDKKLLSPINDNKRDRPLSSYFESPSSKLDNYLQLEHNKLTNNHANNDNLEFDISLDDIDIDSPISKRKSFRDFSILHKSKNQPFKNLTNIVNFSKKIGKSTKNLIKSLKVDEFDQNDDKDKENGNDTVSTIIDSENDTDNDGTNEFNDNDTNINNNDQDIDKLDDTNNTTHDKELLTDLYKLPEYEEYHQHDDGEVEEIDEIDDDELNDVVDCSPKNRGSKTPLKLRRFHSMYHTNKEKDIILQDNSILSNSNINFFKFENDLIPRLDEDSLFKLINNEYNHDFKDIIIIDCRFDYEFNGGHIKNAINISNKQDLEDKFINNTSPQFSNKKLLIFHCEFSLFRGPTMAQHLRKCDRILNLNNYPNLNYPDILILQGGYKKFFEKYKVECFPQNYIEMNKKSPELDKFKSLAKSNNYNHLRSNSYTTITSHSENLKILKRQRSITSSLTRASTFCYSNENTNTPNPLNTTTVPNYHNNTSSTANTVSNNNSTSLSNLVMEEFQPPILNFGLNRSSNSITSLNSSLSELSTFSSNDSSDSVSISNSPIMEMNEFFTSSNVNTTVTNNSTINSNNSILKNSTSNSTLNFNIPKISHHRSNSNSSLKKKKKDFTFPNKSPRRLKPINTNVIQSSNHSRNNSISNSKSQISSLHIQTSNHSRNHSRNQSISHGHNHSLNFIHSSPVISSPLSNTTPLPTPISTLTSISNNSMIDPINDAPVEFLPYDKKF